MNPISSPKNPLSASNPHEAIHRDPDMVIFGFWVFMMSDLIFFGVVFAIYITMVGATAGGPGPKELFDFGSLFAQTMFLLTSSLTVGIATVMVKHERSRASFLFWVVITLLLGMGFLGLELYDFSVMAEKGGVPQRSGYLSAFFGLVPLHGLHVTFGCLWMIVLIVQVFTMGLCDVVKLRFLRLALFWHFLDLIWIGIFSVVYFGGWVYG
ncbi:cytochrome o ubiquinol oxidase subunit III [Microbulbifer sp. A4B17]|uniref:cytochrome c oxidase subunit 3 n=1 Tax=Microbulbifer sp. A4B17 TaxID=359370 RepID=UPI000D52B99A|nr:cytochrome c oxidase subunit 3 [Microbulbifer sp. A4B17]AWF80741.1 cytochrome o ubiquinol oxidase subunit III [Microbulbifer sp. A4B17]